jgi:ABC-type transport system involved in cytochrome c biogenesis ATPase subunit
VTAADAASDAAVIRASRLTKRYGATLALDRLDLAIARGEVYGYLGPNGAGKTTTIRLLLGLHRPTAGDATLFGIDAWRDPVAAHRRVAFVAGEPQLWPSLTGAECLEFLGRLHGDTNRTYRRELVERFACRPDKAESRLLWGMHRRPRVSRTAMTVGPMTRGGRPPMPGRPADTTMCRMNSTLTSDIAPRELCSRSSDGIEVALLWTPGTEELNVTVVDLRSNESLRLPVGARNAMHVFHHPYSYAAGPAS